MGAVARQDHLVFSPGSETGADAIVVSGRPRELRDLDIVTAPRFWSENRGSFAARPRRRAGQGS